MDRPKLILLVGIPGSGKTTYAQKYLKHHNNTIHLSSDLIRKELWGDEAIQGDNTEVFSLMQSRTIDALNNGQNVIYDATNVTRKDRTCIIYQCPKFVNIEAHIVWESIETCIERDASRERTVGKEVIDRMLKRFQAPYYDEGIDTIKVIIPDNFPYFEYANRLYKEMRIPHDNPHHTLDIADHCVAAQRHAMQKRHSIDVYFAAMYHDIGKPYVKAFINSKGEQCEHAHYYQHHCVGAWMAYGFETVDVAWLISTHMDPFMNTKYYNKLPAYLKNKVDQLHECDLAAH